MFFSFKARCASPMGLIANRSDVTWTPIRNNDISWNFQKWLIRHDGHPFRRYTSRTTPQAIENDITELLKECNALSIGNTTAEQQPLQNTQQPQKPLNKRSVLNWLF